MIHWYNVFNPVDMGMCTINRICFYIEDKIGEYKSQLKEREIDWEQFKVKRRCTQEHKDKLQELMNIYINRLALATDTEMIRAKKELVDAKDSVVSFFKGKLNKNRKRSGIETL
jgi:hypothetical protein